MKVLFCTDGSSISYHSILNFSHWVSDCTVDIICVIDLSFLPDSVSVDNNEFGLQCANSADSILDYTEKLLKENNIKVENKIKMCGSTVDSILEVIDETEYDLIVLGSHGKRGIQKWLGSVSQEIASVAKISTFISKNTNNRKKVLFAIDNQENSMKVISKSIDSLFLSDKDIYLINVYEVPDYLFLEGNVDSNWILEVEKKQERAALMMLNQYEKMFNDRNLHITSKVILGGIPAQEIIKYAMKEDIDLVISGARDKKSFVKFLLGSVSKRVLENVKSDMLIIRV